MGRDKDKDCGRVVLWRKHNIGRKAQVANPAAFDSTPVMNCWDNDGHFVVDTIPSHDSDMVHLPQLVARRLPRLLPPPRQPWWSTVPLPPTLRGQPGNTSGPVVLAPCRAGRRYRVRIPAQRGAVGPVLGSNGRTSRSCPTSRPGQRTPRIPSGRFATCWCGTRRATRSCGGTRSTRGTSWHCDTCWAALCRPTPWPQRATCAAPCPGKYDR